MPAILKIKDEKGNIHPIPAIRGEKGNTIETGVYTGTGDFGEEEPNRLTFSFVPKFVCIAKENPMGEFLFWMEGLPCFLRMGGVYAGNGAQVRVSGNTLIFYHTENPLWQYNDIGEKYRYFALG